MMMMSTMRITIEQPPNHIFIFIFLGRRVVNVIAVVVVMVNVMVVMVIMVVISMMITWTQQL